LWFYVIGLDGTLRSNARMTYSCNANVSPCNPALASLDARIHLSCRNSFTGQQRYVRYDTVTGLKDIHTTSWAGDTMQLNSLDGFCTAANAPDQTVYCVGRRASDTNPNEPSNRLAVLASYDNGQTWHDFATTDDLGFVPYGITGAREIRDGVEARFGVRLRPEAHLIGVDL